MNKYYSKSTTTYPVCPINIRNILSQFSTFQNKQLSKTIKARLEKDDLIKNWIKIVGPKLAEHTNPLSIQDQKITVMVDEQKWIPVIQQNKNAIEKKINTFIIKKLDKNNKKQNTLFRGQERGYELKLILGEIPSTVFPSTGTLIIEPVLDKEKMIKIERILTRLKNNKKLKQVFYNILIKYYQYNQICEESKAYKQELSK